MSYFQPDNDADELSVDSEHTSSQTELEFTNNSVSAGAASSPPPGVPWHDDGLAALQRVAQNIAAGQSPIQFSQTIDAMHHHFESPLEVLRECTKPHSDRARFDIGLCPLGDVPWHR